MPPAPLPPALELSAVEVALCSSEVVSVAEAVCLAVLEPELVSEVEPESLADPVLPPTTA